MKNATFLKKRKAHNPRDTLNAQQNIAQHCVIPVDN